MTTTTRRFYVHVDRKNSRLFTIYDEGTDRTIGSYDDYAEAERDAAHREHRHAEYILTETMKHTAHEAPDDTVPCTGGCGELVPEPEEGDPYCEDCALLLIPEDVRAMKPYRAQWRWEEEAAPEIMTGEGANPYRRRDYPH